MTTPTRRPPAKKAAPKKAAAPKSKIDVSALTNEQKAAALLIDAAKRNDLCDTFFKEMEKINALLDTPLPLDDFLEKPIPEHQITGLIISGEFGEANRYGENLAATTAKIKKAILDALKGAGIDARFDSYSYSSRLCDNSTQTTKATETAKAIKDAKTAKTAKKAVSR